MFDHSFWIFRSLVFLVVLSLLPAIVPAVLLASLRLAGAIRWKVPAHGIRPERKSSLIGLLLTCWAGSFVGVANALLSLFLVEEWGRHLYPHRVHDGQAILVIIYSAPVSGFLGSVLAVVGYRLCLYSSPESLFTAPWLYSGDNRIKNSLVATAFFAAMLGCAFTCGFLVNWILLRPGLS